MGMAPAMIKQMYGLDHRASNPTTIRIDREENVTPAFSKKERYKSLEFGKYHRTLLIGKVNDIAFTPALYIAV
jgi:hypothetical protein